MFAVPGGIRTPNLLIRSQLLYPVELQTLSVPPKLSAECPERKGRTHAIRLSAPIHGQKINFL